MDLSPLRPQEWLATDVQWWTEMQVVKRVWKDEVEAEKAEAKRRSAQTA